MRMLRDGWMSYLCSPWTCSKMAGGNTENKYSIEFIIYSPTKSILPPSSISTIVDDKKTIYIKALNKKRATLWRFLMVSSGDGEKELLI